MNPEETCLPEGKQPTLRMVPMPADTNALGNIFGGWIMSQVDIAASIAAIRQARGRVVTVAVNSFEFKHPVFVGDVVSFYADVAAVGRTSMTVVVECFSERLVQGEHKVVRVTKATLTFVAVDENGRPRPVPPAAETL
ncbi:MAG: acyl-CoA thioesterase [Pseudomonadota bacterium]